MKILALALVVCFAFVARTALAVEGQVFIVTKGGMNVKLGLVAVQALSKADVDAYMAKVLPALSSQYSETENSLASNMKAFNTGMSVEAMDANIKRSETLSAQLNSITLKLLSGLNFKPVAQTKSDADGKFNLPIENKGELYVVAVASRAVGGKVEKYRWIIPGKEVTAPFFLSNDNMTNTLPEIKKVVTGATNLKSKK